MVSTKEGGASGRVEMVVEKPSGGFTTGHVPEAHTALKPPEGP